MFVEGFVLSHCFVMFVIFCFLTIVSLGREKERAGCFINRLFMRHAAMQLPESLHFYPTPLYGQKFATILFNKSLSRINKK